MDAPSESQEETADVEPEVLEEAIETKQETSIAKVEDWLGEINPDYDEFDISSPYSNNCGSCALAVHNRINGIEDSVATDKTLSIEEMNEATGMEQVEMSPDEIAAYMLEQGDGADSIVGIDRVEGPGHWFNVKNEAGALSQSTARQTR